METRETRFVLTHVTVFYGRTLVCPNQGRYHYASRAEAEQALEELRPQLTAKLGLKDLKVCEVPAYAHGDVKCTVFIDD